MHDTYLVYNKGIGVFIDGLTGNDAHMSRFNLRRRHALHDTYLVYNMGLGVFMMD